MKLIDFFFYKSYLFLIKLKKDEGDSKWSAFLFTGFYLTAFFVSLVSVIGLLNDNSVCSQLKNNPFSFSIIVSLLTDALLGLRYYRFTNITMIEESYFRMGKVKRIFIDLFLYLAPFAIPILTFILFRLYVVGHFKWW